MNNIYVLTLDGRINDEKNPHVWTFGQLLDNRAHFFESTNGPGFILLPKPGFLPCAHIVNVGKFEVHLGYIAQGAIAEGAFGCVIPPDAAVTIFADGKTWRDSQPVQVSMLGSYPGVEYVRRSGFAASVEKVWDVDSEGHYKIDTGENQMGIKHIRNFKMTEYKNKAMAGEAYYTPSLIDERLLDERQLRILFRRSMLDAGKAAMEAGTINAAQFQTIVTLYKSPWILNQSTRETFDLLESVRKYINDLHQSAEGSYVWDWYSVRNWLASSTVLLGEDGTATTSGLLYAIAHYNPNL